MTLVATVAVCAEQAERADLVQELLARSRLLEDIHFRVPRAVWWQYLQETLQPQKGLPAPVAAVPEEGVYSLSLPASRKPLLAATLRLRVLDPERSGNLPVFSAAWAWEDIQVNGQPAKLATVDGWLRLSPAAPGECVVTGRLPLREATPAGGSLRLEIPQLVRTFVGFDSPEAWEVAVDGHFARLRGEAAGGTHGQLALTPRNRLSLTYERPGIVTEHPPRYALRGSVAWNLDPAAQQVTADLDIGIIGGSTERLEFGLPASAERLAISGPDVRETQVAGGRATVFLRGRTAERTRLRVACEMPLAKSGTQRLDGLSLEDGHWAGGTLVITSTAGSSEVLAASMAGLRQLAIADVPPSARATLGGPPALAYEISARTWSAEVEVLDLGEFALRESIADLAHYQLAFQNDGTVLCKASYEIRNRTRQFLRVDLPRGATALQARVNDESKPLTPVAGAPDAWLLPLVRSLASVRGLVTFPVDVVFMCRVDGLGKRGEARLPLPRIDLPIAYAWCEAYVPQGMGVSRWAGPLSKVERYSNETAMASMSYGLGLAAEGYKPRERRVPKPEAKPKEAPETPPAQPQPPAPTPGPDESQYGLSQLKLGKNYYRAGRESYERGDYSVAARNLEQAVALNPKSAEADNARRLLANIKVVQGQTEGVQASRSQAEKVATVQVTKEVQAGFQKLQEQQQTYIERGFDAASLGDSQAAKTSLEAAESLGYQLLDQGASKQEQDAILRPVREVLGSLRGRETAQTKEVLKQVQELKGKGRYEEALQTARQLGRYSSGAQAGSGRQRLVIEAETQKAREAEHEVLTKRLDVLHRKAKDQVQDLSRLGVQLRPDEKREELLREDPAAGISSARERTKRLDDFSGLREKVRALEEAVADQSGRLAKLQPKAEPANQLFDLYSPKSRVTTPALPRGERRPAGRLEERPKPKDRLRDKRQRADADEIVARLNWEATIREALTTKKVSFDFVATPFQDAIAFLSSEADVAIVVDSDAVKAGAEVTLRMNDAPLGKALDRTLKLAGLRYTLQDEAIFISRPEQVAKTPTLRMYDVTDLTVDIKNFEGRQAALASDSGYSARQQAFAKRQQALASEQQSLALEFNGPEGKGKKDEALTGESLAEFIKKTIAPGTWEAEEQGKPRFAIAYRNGRIVTEHKVPSEGAVAVRDGKLLVLDTPRGQKQVSELLTKLRRSGRAQVQFGEQVTSQQAKGLVGTDFAVDEDLDDVRRWRRDERFQTFVTRNYGWQFETPAQRGADKAGEPADAVAGLGDKLAANLGQKVQVNSVNLSVSPQAAADLGVTFVAGRNGVLYTLVDEAQLRTLLELDADKRAKTPVVAANPSDQETIVGTTALLANGMVVNVQYAGDFGNSLDLNGNPVDLAHQKYVLVNNGGYLTAVQTNPMQHWTEPKNPFPFVVTAQEIEVPRVGALVKFEKTLVEPGDELVLRATYRLSAR